MERINLTLAGKTYVGVKLDGKCVSDYLYHFDYIILAEEALDDAISEEIEHGDNNDMAIALDETIYGYAKKDLILNGSEKELELYAYHLL